MLSALDDAEVEALWKRSDRSAPTPRTVTTLEELRARLAQVRQRGWALVDQELEMGVRSIAAPVHDPRGHAIAAINVSTHVSRTTKADVLTSFVPVLLDAAARLDDVLAQRPTCSQKEEPWTSSG